MDKLRKMRFILLGLVLLLTTALPARASEGEGIDVK